MQNQASLTFLRPRCQQPTAPCALHMLQCLQQHTNGKPNIKQPHALAITSSLPGVLERDLSIRPYVLSLISYQICSEA